MENHRQMEPSALQINICSKYEESHVSVLFCFRICEKGNAYKTKCMIHGGYQAAIVCVFPLATSLAPCDGDDRRGVCSSVPFASTCPRPDFLGSQQLPPCVLSSCEQTALGTHLALSLEGRMAQATAWHSSYGWEALGRELDRSPGTVF